MKKVNHKGPRVLFIDIETAPILAWVWSIWDQNIGLNQIERDWHILSYSAKWLNDPDKDIIYADNRKAKNVEEDGKLLQGIWNLLDSADVVIGHNSKKFDIKKLNARFIQNGMKPPSSFKQIDTLSLSKKYFAFTSNKLEYLSNKLCKKYKKLKHSKFSGFELWKSCIAGNKEAWNEMERYNKVDVLALQELYNKISPWDNGVNFSLYNDSVVTQCKCGSSSIQKNGFAYTTTAKFQRYLCASCGSETRGRKNLFSKDKMESLKIGTSR